MKTNICYIACFCDNDLSLLSPLKAIRSNLKTNVYLKVLLTNKEIQIYISSQPGRHLM